MRPSPVSLFLAVLLAGAIAGTLSAAFGSLSGALSALPQPQARGDATPDLSALASAARWLLDLLSRPETLAALLVASAVLYALGREEK
jgi:hypothetical protein